MPVVSNASKNFTFHFFMELPVIKRLFETKVCGKHQFWVVLRFCIKNPGAVMFNEFFDLLAGTGKNYRVFFCFGQALYDRIIGDIKRGDEQKRHGLLVVKVPKQVFLELDLLLEFLEIRGGSDHFCKCNFVITSDEQQVEFRKILTVASDYDVTIF